MRENCRRKGVDDGLDAGVGGNVAVRGGQGLCTIHGRHLANLVSNFQWVHLSFIGARNWRSSKEDLCRSVGNLRLSPIAFATCCRLGQRPARREANKFSTI